MISKKQTGYLILCTYSVVVFLGYIATTLISPGPNSVPGAYEFVYLVFLMPCFALIYGIASHILTKRVVIPNFIFALTFNFLVIFSPFSQNFLEALMESWPVGIILFAISTTCSLITKFILAFLIKNKKSKKQ
ncbi:MAG: hypothetical protein IKC31_00525 [Clostridia bacterium]|nr:hypothetical protein [Clostridia bacterium]